MLKSFYLCKCDFTVLNVLHSSIYIKQVLHQTIIKLFESPDHVMLQRAPNNS